MYMGDQTQSLISIVGTGAFRIKCRVNEQNMSSVQTGAPVLIHSRVDEEQIWNGTMGEIDTQNPGRDDSNSSYFIGGDSTAT